MDERVCSSHPDEPAVGECAHCGEALCEACVFKETRQDGPVCSRECYMHFVARGAGGPSHAGRVSPLVAFRMALAVVTVTIVLLVILAGDELLAAAYWVLDKLGLPRSPGQ